MTPLFLTDAVLVNRTLSGDSNSFEQLVQRHLTTVRAIAGLYAQSPSDVDDLTQESFLKAYTSLDSLKDRGRFGGWIATITRNTAIRQYQKRARERELKSHMAEMSDSHAQQAPEERELFATIRSLTEQLSENHREVLVLHYFAGHDCRYIAKLLDISHASVRKRLQRAREALGQELLSALQGVTPAKTESETRAKTITGAVIGTQVAWVGTAQASTSMAGAVIFTAAAAAITATVAATIAAVVFVSGGATQSPGMKASSSGAPSLPPTQLAQIDSDNAASAAEQAQTTATTALSTTESEASGPGAMGARYTYPDGRPASSANVTILRRTWEPHQRVPAGTPRPHGQVNSDGITRSDNMPLGSYGIQVTTEDGYGALIDATLTATRPEAFAEITLQPVTDIQGLVLDHEDNPIANARVLFVEHIDTEQELDTAGDLTERITNVDGRFEIQGIPIGRWRVYAEADDYGMIVSVVTVGDGQDLIIDLHKPSSLSGTLAVSDGAAAPANMPVTLLSENPRYRPITITNTDGAFAFNAIGSGEYTLALQDARQVVLQHDAIRVRRGRAVHNAHAVIAEGAIVRGVLRDNTSGNPVAGVEVHAIPKGQLAITRTTTTNEDGSYELAGIAPGKFMIQPKSPMGYKLPFGRYQRGREQEFIPGAAPKIDDLELEQCVLVQGIVQHEGKPVPYARVGVGGGGGTYVGGSVTADENGRYAIHFIPISGDLWLAGYKDELTSRPIELEFRQPKTHTEDIALGLAARATGIVVSENGSPIPGAIVSSNLKGSRWGGSSATADASGRFELTGIEPGLHTVHIRSDDGPYVISEGSSVAEYEFKFGDNLTGLELVAKAGGTISGQVLDENGSPISGAVINAQGNRGNTDENGRFSINKIYDESVQFSAIAPGYMQHNLWAVPRGTENIVVRLQPPPRVKFRVVDDLTGEPVEDCKVGLVAWDRPYLTGFTRSSLRSMESDEGIFELPFRFGLLATVWAVAPGYAAGHVIVEGQPGNVSDNIVVRLEKSGPVTGRVVDPAGVPIANCFIFYRAVSNTEFATQEIAARTNSDGTFSIEGMPTTPSPIAAAIDGYAHAFAMVRAGDNITLELGEPIPRTFRILRDGEPLTGVALHYEVDDEIQCYGLEIATDEEGLVTASHVPPLARRFFMANTDPGDHYTTAYFPIYDTDPNTPMEIDLGHYDATLEGTISNYNPLAWQYVRVEVHQTNGDLEYMTYGRVAWDGKFTYAGLPGVPARIVVKAVPYGSLQQVTEYETDLPPGQATSFTITL